jgi:hypothetical protein
MIVASVPSVNLLNFIYSATAYPIRAAITAGLKRLLTRPPTKPLTIGCKTDKTGFNKDLPTVSAIFIKESMFFLNPDNVASIVVIKNPKAFLIESIIFSIQKSFVPYRKIVEDDFETLSN